MYTYLFNFICKAPYDLSPLPSKNSNLTIVMRYNSQERKNTYKPQTTKRIRWTENDDKVFDQHIYLSKENKLYDIYNYYSKTSIASRIKVRKELIYNRPLESYEVFIIDQHIYKGYSLEVAANFLRLRTVASVKKLAEQRKRYLQLNGFIK